MGISRYRERLGLGAAIAAASVFLSYAAQAGPGPKTCGAKIKSCCVAKSSKVFTVVNPLNSSSVSEDCIVVTASDVVLNLNDNDLKGPGGAVTGNGIHVMPSAKDVFIEANGATISGFANGVEDDANGMRFDAGSLDGNRFNGMFINGASNSSLDDSGADTNGAAGVLIMNGTDDQVHDSGVNNNLGYGIEIDGGSGNVVQDSTANSNSLYGLWVRGSNGNRVHDSDGNNNLDTGIYIGCADTAGPGGACTVASVGHSNVVEETAAKTNGAFGIGVDSGDLQNQVGRNVATGNKTTDLVDINASCATNLWFLDSFTTSSQMCIH